MQISNFIITDEEPGYQKNQTIIMRGEVYIPLGIPVPVIRKGVGCIGLGIVKELRITLNETTVKFSLDETLSREDMHAYYNLYRNGQSSSKSNGSPYENTDAVIPGAINSLRGNKKEKQRAMSYTPEEEALFGGKRRRTGLSDIADWDD